MSSKRERGVRRKQKDVKGGGTRRKSDLKESKRKEEEVKMKIRESETMIKRQRCSGATERNGSCNAA